MTCADTAPDAHLPLWRCEYRPSGMFGMVASTRRSGTRPDGDGWELMPNEDGEPPAPEQVERFHESVEACMAEFARAVAEPPTPWHKPRHLLDDWGHMLAEGHPPDDSEVPLGEWAVRGTGSGIVAVVGGFDNRPIVIASYEIAAIRKAAQGY